MPVHSSRIEFLGVVYIESSGLDEQGTGVITWRREGHKPQIMDYYDPDTEGSLEAAKDRIRNFVRSIPASR